MSQEPEKVGSNPISRNVSVYTGQIVFTNMLGFLYIAFLARILTLSQIGLLASVQTISMLIAFSLSMALPTAITRETSRLAHLGEWGGVVRTSIGALRFVGLLSIVAAILMIVGGSSLSSVLFGNDTIWVIWIMAFDIPLQSAYLICSAHFQGIRRFGVLAVVSIAGVLTKYLPGVYSAYVTADVAWTLFFLLIGDVVSAGGLLAILLHQTRKWRRVPGSSVGIRQLLEYSAPLTVPFYVSNLSREVERVFALLWVGLASLAIYSISATIVLAVSMLYTSISGAIFPSLVQTLASEGKDRLIRNTTTISRLVALVYFPIVGCIVAIGYKPFIWVFGMAYSDSFALIAVMLLGTLISCFSVSVTPIVLALGQTKIISKGAAIGSIAFIAMFIAIGLVFSLPLLGLAAARSILYIISFMYTYQWLKRNHGSRIDYSGVLRITISLVLSIIIASALSTPSGTVTAVGLTIVLFFLVYILILRSLKVVRESDVEILAGFLPETIRNPLLKLLGTLLVRG